MADAPRVLVLHGPNLNLLGTREPSIYGTATLDDIHAELGVLAKARDAELEFFQSNHEGALVDRIQEAPSWADAILINPGGLTHTSVVLRDALAATGLPVVEVHLSNVDEREEWRRLSVLEDVRAHRIVGKGADGYREALEFLQKGAA